MFGIILLPWWCWCVVMDALFSPFTVEMVDYSTPVHLLEVFLFFISWPPKMMISDIMICEKGFKLWSMFCGFFAFLDITWNHEQMRPHCCCRRLKNLDIVAKVMVVDRFIRPCCLCWCWVILFHLFFFVSYLLFGCYLKICGHLNAEHVAYFLWTVCHLALHWECIYIFFNDSLHQERLQNPNQDVVCFTPNELLYCIPSF